MLIYATLLYNGAEGSILENFTLRFKKFDDFASFFWFLPKLLQGVPKSQGVPSNKELPQGGVAPPATPGRSGPGFYLTFKFNF